MQKIIDKFCNNASIDNDILAILLYGSCARQENDNISDIDICIALKTRTNNKDCSAKRHQYLTKFDLDIHIFQQLPLYIQMRVIREGKVLFCYNEDALYATVFKTIQEYEDEYRFIYHDYLKEVSHG